jgi:methylated-DNA-[protein]-cysteine S-methyltransferase
MENGLEICSPLGVLTLTERDGRITRLSFGAFGTAKPNSALLRAAADQLRAYFDGKLFRFDLPLTFEGTPFQCDVWNALSQIPFGETRSYAEIARAVGRPNACRAVGGAVHANPIPIIIPCHRVIGADGSLGGYFAGTEIKKQLLFLEGISVERRRMKKAVPPEAGTALKNGLI